MEFPNLVEGVAFVIGMIGLGGLGGYADTGEGLICSVCLMTVCGVLVFSAKIVNEKKRK